MPPVIVINGRPLHCAAYAQGEQPLKPQTGESEQEVQKYTNTQIHIYKYTNTIKNIYKYTKYTNASTCRESNH